MIIKESTEEFFLEDYDKGTQQWEALKALDLKGKSVSSVEQLRELVSKEVTCPIKWAETEWVGEYWNNDFTLSVEDIVAKTEDRSSFRVATDKEKSDWEQGLQELFSRRVDIVLCDVTNKDIEAIAEQGIEIW